MNTWTVRLVAAAILSLCCALMGRALCAKEVRRVQMLSSLRAALPMLTVEMLERMMPLPGALRLSGQPLLVRLALQIEQGMGAREAWVRLREQLTQQGQMLDCLLEDDLLRLDQLFDGLGISGISAQRLLLQESERAIERQHQQAQVRAQERGKLFTNLGLLLGLAIAVCLL